MAANPQPIYMTEDEYLAFDRASEFKHEYLNGEAVAMSGGTVNHGTLAGNMFYLIKEGLGKGWPYRVYNSDMRVLVERRQYVYPDVTVSCDVSDHRGDSDILRSPHLVVEVLSPSTERMDRGQKFQWYTNHPCIEEYVIVNTCVQMVELYRREQGKDGYSWRYFSWSAGEVIELNCLDLQIPVDELYAGLRIPLPGEDQEESSRVSGYVEEADFL